MLKINWLTN